MFLHILGLYVVGCIILLVKLVCLYETNIFRHHQRLKIVVPKIYRVSRFYRFLWFASERYLIFRFSKDWCLIFFLNMGDLLFEQKIWLKVNFMVLYDISKSNVQYWVFHQNCSKSSKKINFTPTFYPFLDFYGNIMCLWNAKI